MALKFRQGRGIAAMTQSDRTLDDLLRDVAGWLPLLEAEYLRAQAQRARGAIVEIGCYRGRSTIALCMGASEAGPEAPLVYSVDPHQPTKGVYGGSFGPEDRAAYYKNMLASGFADRAALINLPSEKVAAIWDRPIGLLFIDGDHRYEAVKRDAQVWLPYLVAGGVVIFDDVNDSNGGPHRVVAELLHDHGLETVEIVGKLHALRKL
jgi:predicted O-methyltransferase YrrM